MATMANAQIKRLQEAFSIPHHTLLDSDKDKTPDIIDCAPFNPLLHEVARLTKEERKAKVKRLTAAARVRGFQVKAAPPIVYTTPGSAKRIAEALREKGDIETKIGIVHEGKTVYTTPISAARVAEALKEKPLKVEVEKPLTEAEIMAQKLGLPSEKVLGPVPVKYFIPEERERPTGVIGLRKEWTKEELAERERLLYERMGGGFITPKWEERIKRKTEELAGWLPIPFARKKEEKELELAREEGKYVLLTKDEELIGARLARPPEIPVYEAITEQEKLAEETEIILSEKYRDRGTSQVNFVVSTSQEKVNIEQAKLQKQINEGKISVKKAQSELDKLITSENKWVSNRSEQINKTLNAQMQKEFEKTLTPKFKEIGKISEAKAKQETKKYRKTVVLATLPETIMGGAIIGVAGTLIPPLGTIYGGVFGARLATHFPETVEYFKEAPLAATIETAGFVGGAMVGAKVTAGLKTRFVTQQMIKGQVSKLPKVQQIQFKKYWAESLKIDKKAGFVPVKKVSFAGLKRLPKKLHEPTKTFIRNKGDVLGGSQAMRTMLYGKAKAPMSRWIKSDIDLYTKGNVNLRATKLSNIYKGLGVKRVSVVPNTGRITIGGIKAVEFHSIEMLYGNLRTVTPLWRPLKSNIRTSPTGIKVAPILGMQGRRLLIRTYLDEKMGPATAKYMTDFGRIEQSLIREAMMKQRMRLPEERIFKPKIEDIFKIKKPPIPVTKLPKIKLPKVYKPFVYPKYPIYPKYPLIIPLITYPTYPKPKYKPPILKVTPYPYKPLKVTEFFILPYKIPVVKAPEIKVLPYPERITKYPTTLISDIFIPTVPKYKPRERIRIEPFKEIKKVIVKRRRKEVEGYNVFGKPLKRKGKQRGYIRLNKAPLTKLHAQSLGAFAIDTSLSRTFKVKKTKRKAQLPRLSFPRNYFIDKGHKFRGYRIKKGKRISLKNKWIEKNPFLLDTRQELRDITLAKRLVQMGGGRKKVKKSTKRKGVSVKRKKGTSNYLKKIQEVFQL